MPPSPPEDAPTGDRRDIAAARLALRCLDLTWLPDRPQPGDGGDDLSDGSDRGPAADASDDAAIVALAVRADTPHGAPAALCVWPRFAAAARRALDARGLAAVRVTTVVNFPHGDAAPQAVADQIAAARAAGADEIDAALPWRALRDGDDSAAIELLRACRRACDDGDARPPALLKVILETGELREAALIRRAAALAIDGGADFIKTSTGKVAVNATPAAVAAVLETIVERGGGRVGLKVAGGVATLADVRRYLALVHAACGEAALVPGRLRFGASSLLPVLLAALDGAAAVPAAALGY